MFRVVFFLCLTTGICHGELKIQAVVNAASFHIRNASRVPLE